MPFNYAKLNSVRLYGKEVNFSKISLHGENCIAMNCPSFALFYWI